MQSNSVGSSPIGPQILNGSHIQITPINPIASLQASDVSLKDLTLQDLPSASLVVQNLLTRFGQDVKEHIDTLLPKINGIHLMKRAFRDIFIKETVHVFEFLDKSIDKNPILTKATDIVKRFGRTDYNSKKTGIRDLSIDVDCRNVLDSLQMSLQITGNTADPLGQWMLQTKQILEQWRLATTQLATAEKNLENHCNVFDDILKKTRIILELPSSTNIYQEDGEVTPYKKMLVVAEEYIQKMFDDNCIEESFHEYCRVLKKVALLTDAMNAIRTWINVSSEPLCSICITEPISMAYVPCGHTFCKSCGQRQSMTCHVCRAPIREKLKLYFS